MTTNNSNNNAPKITEHINIGILNDDVIDITERETINQNLLKEINVKIGHFLFYIKHLHSSIKPIVARYTYIYIHMPGRNNYMQKKR